ncbi:MAG: MBOAT family O-acyltransferase [Bacteroidota bacterium]
MSYTIILIASIAVNYIFGLFIQKNIEQRRSWYWLCAGVTTNLLLLGVFKYTNFIVRNINHLLDFGALPLVPETSIVLPIGISFYTFHSISYLVDIYRRKATAQKNIFDLSLYIAMFSQLVAGPIIRYSDVSWQLKSREHNWLRFGNGVERFLIGLGKKVLLANTLGGVVDALFKTNPAELGALNAWLGAVCYSLQIYCDFAGYSDMAIGLGKMFGFEFFENFNYPYLARSVKDFWRRWHISLSTFFRDYVYIPLGGNRVSNKRRYLNLVIVFLVTGFWHGAACAFVAWGLFHGFFMVLENLFLEKLLQRRGKFVANLYTLLIVIFAWVLFRADSIKYAGAYWKAMFDFTVNPKQAALFYGFMNYEFLGVIVITLTGTFGFFKWLNSYLEKVLSSEKPIYITLSYSYHLGSSIVYLLILILSTMYLVAGSYNPFIYYRF